LVVGMRRERRGLRREAGMEGRKEPRQLPLPVMCSCRYR
jgi:hypothetical protein